MIQRIFVRAPLVAITVGLNVAGGVCGVDAASTNASMEVSLHVSANCMVEAEPMSFGSVTAAQAPATQSASTISVRCTESTPFQVTMDDGSHPGSGTRRAFDSATGQYAAYEIYADAGQTRRWGTLGTEAVSGTADSSRVVQLAAFGRISPNARVAAGDYRGVVTVAVAF